MKARTWLHILLLTLVSILSITSVQAATTYEWDANGNMTSSLDDAGNSATYTYDGKNQLTRVERQLADGSSIVVEYEYDWKRNRTAKIVNGVRTNYIVDSNRPLPVVLMETDGNNQIIASYTYEPDGYLPISQTRNGETYIYHYDGSDNVRMLTDSSGNVAAQYAYDAHGKLLFAVGDIENNFLFSGQQYDSDAGLYYHRARYRDPNTSRFTQMDTFQGVNHDPITLHKYLYANADPVNVTDPSGLFGISELSVTINIVSTLTSLQIENGFSVLDSMGVSDPAIDNARLANRAIGILTLGAAGTQLIKLLSKKGKSFFSKAGTNRVSDLRGTQFENYLQSVMGSSAPFKVGKREFDGAWGKTWFEAKSGNAFNRLVDDPKAFNRFKSVTGEAQKIAKQNGAQYIIVSNTSIPPTVKSWLTERGIRFVEIID